MMLPERARSVLARVDPYRWLSAVLLAAFVALLVLTRAGA